MVRCRGILVAEGRDSCASRGTDAESGAKGVRNNPDREPECAAEIPT